MDDMTISQALRRVKKLKGKLDELNSRAQSGVSYKAADKPAFPFASTLEEADSVRAELLGLKARIAVTNATNSVDFDGKSVTLAFAVLKLQELKSQIAWYRGLVVHAQESTSVKEPEMDHVSGRYIYLPVEMRCDLPEAKRAATVDRLQDEFDRLNDAVERKNHAVAIAAA